MLGHDDIRPMGYMEALPQVLHGRNDPFSSSIPRQQWETLKTGVRQEVRVSGFIPGNTGLSRKPLHGDQHIGAYAAVRLSNSHARNSRTKALLTE